MTKQLKSLFEMFALTIKMPTTGVYDTKKRQYKKEWVKLDYNPNYGGYRIDIVESKTGERFFHFSQRITAREMVMFLQGFLLAKDPHIKQLYKI